MMTSSRTFPVLPWADDAARGITTSRLARLLERRADGYDAAAARRRIDALPWVTTGSGRSAVRLVDQPGERADALPVVLLHGWPDSVLRFERVLPLLAERRVVVPALPGFPFSAPWVGGGMPAVEMAEVVAAALEDVGCTEYVVSGGDVGGVLGEIMAARFPDRVRALHLTNVAPQRALGVDPTDLDEEGRAYLALCATWFRTEGAYIATQSTRPTTLALALGSSFEALAAWILEKLDAWSDGTDGPAFSDDDALDWIDAYWHSGTIGTSFTAYTEPTVVPARVETPTVLSTFAHDFKLAPLSYLRRFVDVQEHRVHARGGHFAAWERPAEYVEDVRAAIALAAPGGTA